MEDIHILELLKDVSSISRSVFNSIIVLIVLGAARRVWLLFRRASKLLSRRLRLSNRTTENTVLVAAQPTIAVSTNSPSTTDPIVYDAVMANLSYAKDRILATRATCEVPNGTRGNSYSEINISPELIAAQKEFDAAVDAKNKYWKIRYYLAGLAPSA